MKTTPIFLSLLLEIGITTISRVEKPALLSLRYNKNYSPTYDEVIAMYRQLNKVYPQARLI